MERKLILVVDDDFDIRESIRDAFALAGYETVDAGDGFAALALLRERRVDLVVTDLQMPGMDGRQLLAAMQADALLGRIPVCVVSAEGGSLPPATRVIRKPFELRAVLEAIDEALNQKCPNQYAA